MVLGNGLAREAMEGEVRRQRSRGGKRIYEGEAKQVLDPGKDGDERQDWLHPRGGGEEVPQKAVDEILQKGCKRKNEDWTAGAGQKVTCCARDGSEVEGKRRTIGCEAVWRCRRSRGNALGWARSAQHGPTVSRLLPGACTNRG